MSEEYASEVKEIVGSLWKVFVGTAVIVGTGYLITTAWERSVSQVGEHQMEMACEQSFSDPATAKDCKEWSLEHYNNCLDNPPQHLIEHDRGGEGESSPRSAAEICQARQIEHFSRIHRVPVSESGEQMGAGAVDRPPKPSPDDESMDSKNGESDEASGFRPTREFRPTRPVQVE